MHGTKVVACLRWISDLGVGRIDVSSVVQQSPECVLLPKFNSQMQRGQTLQQQHLQAYNLYSVSCKDRLLADFCRACMYDQPCILIVCLHGMSITERQEMLLKPWQSTAKLRGALNQIGAIGTHLCT